MRKTTLSLLLIVGCLVGSGRVCAQAQTGPPAGTAPVAPPPIVPEAFRVPAPPPEIGQPWVPPGCSMALCDPPPQKPNAFCGEHDPNHCVRTLNFTAEYLHWWIRNSPLPPLLTTSNNPAANAGFLDEPGTVVLIGGADVDYGVLPGGRLGGMWSPDNVVFLDGRVFWLDEQPNETRVASDALGNPVLARPIFGTQFIRQNQNPEVVFVVAFPGQQSGGMIVRNSSRLRGYELNLGSNVGRGENWFVDVLAGFRTLKLDEELSIVATTLNLVDDPPLVFDRQNFGLGARVDVADVFNTHNLFRGGQVGIRGTAFFGPFSLAGDVRVALGRTAHASYIAGLSKLTVTEDIFTVPGGVLAVRSNSGVVTDRTTTLIPELGATFGYRVADNIQLTAGFNFLYWERVARAGSQVNRRVDTRQIPTDFEFAPGSVLVNPMPSLRLSKFWATGLTFGALFTF